MLTHFKVGELPITYYRNWFTGKAELRAQSQVIPLASPWKLSTHFSIRQTKVTRVRLGGHEIVIEQAKPPSFGAIRPHVYTITVDGSVVGQERG